MSDDPAVGAAGDSSRTLELRVPDMDCPTCAGKVENSVARLEGIDGIEPRVTSGRLVVGYDPTRTSEAEIRERVRAAGYEIDSRTAERTFSVPDMDCASCASKVENALAATDGVDEIETRPASGRVTVTVADDVDSATVTDAIEGAGYDAMPMGDHDGNDPAGDDRAAVWKSRRAVGTAVGALILTVGMALEFVFTGADPTLGTVVGRTYELSHLLFIAAVVVAGTPILRNGYYSARNRSLDIDFLMSLGIVASVVAHHPFEGAMLAVLFSVAELLERFSMDRARDSLRELMDLSPDTATAKREDGSEETIPADDLEIGDVVIVRPGEKIPADGVVLDGESAVDQSPITGESVPEDKATGDEVYAGTIAESGYLEIEVESAADDSTIARIVRMVEDAEREKTDREQFIDRFASVYTPIVVALAVAAVVVPPLAFGASWSYWFVVGLTLLVISCPCALVISTPVSVVSGITSAARNGVLIKGGKHLETMGESDVLAVDKTGTLTEGDLSVTDVIPLEGVDEDDVLRRASALERRSEHPIGQAIVGYADEQGIAIDGGGEDDPEVSNFEALTGKGVRGEIDGMTHYVGKPALFDGLADLEHTHATTDGGVALEEMGYGGQSQSQSQCEREGCLDVLSEVIPDLQAAGKTVVIVGTEDRPIGVIGVADRVRPEAKWAVSRLQAQGVRVVMLTGDNEGTARAIAETVGIDDYHAELLPDEKLEWIRRLEGEAPRVRESQSDSRRPSDVLNTSEDASERASGERERGRNEVLTSDKRTGNEVTRERSDPRADEYGGEDGEATVAMVGDGINDAPALATASVGIAMGAAGTDTALETADVALMGDDLTRLPYLYDLSGKANGVIRQNIWSSLAIKAVLAVGAPFGIVTVIHAVVIGDMGMSLGVTGNAMRLANVEPETPEGHELKNTN